MPTALAKMVGMERHAHPTDWRIPFDNHLAERRVRPVKVKLKVIGGFRAVGGADAFCVIRSVWETSKLNCLNPFDTLRLAFESW